MTDLDPDGFPTNVHHRVAGSDDNPCQTCGFYQPGECVMWNEASAPDETCDKWTSESPTGPGQGWRPWRFVHYEDELNVIEQDATITTFPSADAQRKADGYDPDKVVTGQIPGQIPQEENRSSQ